MPAGGLLTGAGSAVAGVAGGLIGNLLSSGDRDREMAAKQAALQRILGIDAPTAEQLAVHLSKEQVAGELNPSLEGTVTEGPSSMGGISTDPRLRQAQLTALEQLTQLGGTGLTAGDRAALMQISNQASGDAAAANKATMSNMAARGMAGSGAELASELTAGQQSANREAQNGMNIAAQAQSKALQAMSNAGALGSQMEGQQFGEEAQKASAADAIAHFNAANRQQVMGANTNRTNSADQFNLQNKQNVMNNNTGIANNEATYNSNAKQEAYNDAMGKAKAAAGQDNTIANQYGQNAKDTAGMWAGIGQGVGAGIAAMGKKKSSSSDDESDEE